MAPWLGKYQQSCKPTSVAEEKGEGPSAKGRRGSEREANPYGELVSCYSAKICHSGIVPGLSELQQCGVNVWNEDVGEDL